MKEKIEKQTQRFRSAFPNMSSEKLNAIFKKKIGISPQQYLLNRRMNIAASLIKNHNISVSATAYSVGYTDIYTFSKAFKKHFGVAPTKYRENQSSE